MNSTRRARIIQSHFQNAIKKPISCIKYSMDEKNIGIWYILIHNISGMEDEFKSGEYLVEIDLTERTKFPFGPPHFKFLTENGVYAVDQDVCISIGKFHSSNHPAAMGAYGFIIELMNGLVSHKNLGGGIGLLKSSRDEKRKHAKNSKLSNWQRYPHIMRKIDETFKAYSAKWSGPELTDELREQLGLISAEDKAEGQAEGRAEGQADGRADGRDELTEAVDKLSLDKQS